MVLFTTTCAISLFKKTRNILFFVVLAVLFFYIGINITTSFMRYSSFKRLILENKEDVQTIIARIYFWNKAIEMGLSSPLLGIGLGNYYDYFPKKITKSIIGNRDEIAKMTLIHSHNIFLKLLQKQELLV